MNGPTSISSCVVLFCKRVSCLTSQQPNNFCNFSLVIIEASILGTVTY